MRELAEDLLKDALNDVVMPNLFDPAALNQELDLLGMKLNLGLAIDQVFVDPSGLTIGLAASAMPAVVQNPGKAVRPLPGPDGAVEPSELDIALAGASSTASCTRRGPGALDLQIGGENSAIELPLNLTAALLLVPLAEAGQASARRRLSRSAPGACCRRSARCWRATARCTSRWATSCSTWPPRGRCW
ncbi:MAG: hypothetical protein R3F43_15990 [bacterium]